MPTVRSKYYKTVPTVRSQNCKSVPTVRSQNCKSVPTVRSRCARPCQPHALPTPLKNTKKIKHKNKNQTPYRLYTKKANHKNKKINVFFVTCRALPGFAILMNDRARQPRPDFAGRCCHGAPNHGPPTWGGDFPHSPDTAMSRRSNLFIHGPV